MCLTAPKRGKKSLFRDSEAKIKRVSELREKAGVCVFTF